MAQRFTRPDARGHAMPLPDTVALVLQGGGALGSYQAGVIESLIDLGVEIDWVAGISIGAINAAIVAGNSPENVVSQLRRFWETVSGGMPNLILPEERFIREAAHLSAAAAVAAFGVPGFFRPHMLPPQWSAPGSPTALSYYDTSPLAATIDGLVDWDRLNNGPVRCSIGAVDIESGNFVYFCTGDARWKGRIDARHIMASGALPPGLPPVEIDGRRYWDGGLVSNTPLSHVLDHHVGDILAFQVDLFPAEGPMPRTMSDVNAREKDIRYSSRTRQVTDQYLRMMREHAATRRLIDKLPPEMRNEPEVAELEGMIDVGSVNIVHLIYRTRVWESGAKDFEFSRATMLDHWAQGRESVAAALEKGDLIARNIRDGSSAAFDLLSGAGLKEKKA